MNVEIVIPTILANPGLLTACVEGVYETTGLNPIVAEGGTFAENCNAGGEKTDADVLIFLNDDCELLTGWFEPLIKAFDDPGVGIAGSKLVYANGKLQHAGVAFRHRKGLLEAFNITDIDPPTRLVEAVTGACMAVRADCWNQLRGFDPGFVNGYEDVDLCIRARTKGWRIKYVAESVVIHHESQSGEARWTHVQHNVARLQELYA